MKQQPQNQALGASETARLRWQMAAPPSALSKLATGGMSGQKKRTVSTMFCEGSVHMTVLLPTLYWAANRGVIWVFPDRRLASG